MGEILQFFVFCNTELRLFFFLTWNRNGSEFGRNFGLLFLTLHKKHTLHFVYELFSFREGGNPSLRTH